MLVNPRPESYEFHHHHEQIQDSSRQFLLINISYGFLVEEQALPSIHSKKQDLSLCTEFLNLMIYLG